jgi:hypothetical protein
MRFIKDFIYEFGRAVPYMMTVIMYILFFMAYADPNKGVLLLIDVYGEAFIEAVMLVVLVPIMAYSILRGRKER